MSQGPGAMLAVLGLGTVALVGAFSLALTAAGLSPHSLGENAWKILLRTLDPGTLADDAGWPFRLFMLGVTLVGILLFSALISILSAGLQVRIEDLRKGRSLVVEKNHIVVLGWSAKIFTILRELVAANESRRDSCIVILAERDKLAMEDELRLKLPKRGRTRIVCRAGNPTDPHDLDLVSPQRAKAIVVLAPESSNPDAETVKTILALTSRRPLGSRPYHIVAELRDSDNLRLAQMVGKDEVEFVVADDLVARMTVQACREIGLSLVYTELMDFGGGEMYFHEHRSLMGKSFAEVVLMYPHCAAVGVQRANGKVSVNPPQDYQLQAGDRVVVLAEDESSIRLGPVPEFSGLAAVPVRKIERHPERVLLLGWNDKAPIIIRELDRYLPKDSELTIVSAYDVSQQVDAQIPELENLTTEYWTSSTVDHAVLEGLDVPSYQHVMVLAYSQHLDQQECDSQTLMTLLNLRDICDRENARVGLLSEMLDVRNRELAEVTHADDFIVSDRLVSMVISQVTENKDTMRIFDDLFHHEGSEMFLRPADYLVPLGVEMTFYDVCDLASERGETAVGYRLKDLHFEASEHYGLRLNPRKKDLVRFGEGDQIVVLAQTDV